MTEKLEPCPFDANSGFEDHFPMGLRSMRLMLPQTGEVFESPIRCECYCGAEFTGTDEQEVRQLWAEHALSNLRSNQPADVEALAKHMEERFLGWRLPENFQPDAGISFEPEYNVEWNAKRGLPPSRHEPIGTNLFSAEQAKAMVRYMLEGAPALSTAPADRDGVLLRLVLELRDDLVMAAKVPLADPAIVPELSNLCERVGYGNVMASASVLWREKLGDRAGGEFVASPCRATVERMIHRIDAALKGDR